MSAYEDIGYVEKVSFKARRESRLAAARDRELKAINDMLSSKIEDRPEQKSSDKFKVYKDLYGVDH